jgi:hypothetical protein
LESDNGRPARTDADPLPAPGHHPCGRAENAGINGSTSAQLSGAARCRERRDGSVPGGRSDHRGRTALRRPTIRNDQITEILNRPLSQEMLARDLCRLAYVAKDGTPRNIPISLCLER